MADGFPAWYRAYGDGVNIRTRPDPGATSVGQLQTDDRVLVTSLPVTGGAYGAQCGSQPGDQWYPVDHFGQRRYVITACLERV
ncbi:SH3 domain-containing protein [Saccharopolyspora antimicrobica]|uniref:SH3 domain-containing protein n=1 Tax=Saccharopolyspora antimicrobica TaxID=455193 RepID=A0A1I4U2T6_9PSEU|nr:SH3 domain-containing protein [Saccharopolyspora antimicrobica]RKT88653.1 SH3 domain-containing protein [Saccharopolyspora antimicrobica]SFM83209.1 SH3 domain-containing protein [Saccharopolyspora antimicrobica]